MSAAARPSPTGAAVLIGLEVGAFFDGVVFHQVLQSHHMTSRAGAPTGTVPGLRENTLDDGLSQLSACYALSAYYASALAGIALPWRRAGRAHEEWSSRKMLGGILVGSGLFNLVEGALLLAMGWKLLRPRRAGSSLAAPTSGRGRARQRRRFHQVRGSSAFGVVSGMRSRTSRSYSSIPISPRA